MLEGLEAWILILGFVSGICLLFALALYLVSAVKGMSWDG